MHYIQLNIKFYIAAMLLLVITALGIYGIYFLNTKTILMEDDTPMSVEYKTVFTIVLSLVVLSWLMSLIVVTRQIIRGYAFGIDEMGIHSTLSVTVFLSFIIVVPITHIPYKAIISLNENLGVLKAKFDKSKIRLTSMSRPFLRSNFHFFNGYTKAGKEEIRNLIKNFSGI